MAKWEYARITRTERDHRFESAESWAEISFYGKGTMNSLPNGDVSTIHVVLDELGQEGWELTATETPITGVTTYWLKRPAAD